MALLDMAFHDNRHVEAAHMNYHRRDTADRDEEIVRDYCKEKGIVFHGKDFDEKEYPGNFQAAAREARYDFFSDVVKKRDLDEVLTAHQKDDVIETYLMQRKKKLEVSRYGIREHNVINGVDVYRPLLRYEKKDLLAYCEENHVPYGIDESNLEDGYERNRIRHARVEKMSSEEKDCVIQEIDERNRIREFRYERASSFLDRDSYTVKQFLNIPYLNVWLQDRFPHKSKAFFAEMRRQLKESGKCVFEGEDIVISKEYGRIHVFEKRRDYEYRFDSLDGMKDVQCPWFSLKEEGKKIEGITLREEDFPVIIRNAREGDAIAMRFGHKKVNRFLIDRKTLLKDRMSWPVMTDADGKVIFVSGMGCDADHYTENNNVFMIKL